MRRNEFAELSVFLEIVERGSFVRAAAHLGVSSPALSQSMKQLETRLGVRLLHRTTRSLSPTEAGERLIEGLRPAIADLNDAVEAINGHRESPHGRVRITVSRVAAELVLQPRLPAFRRDFPDVALEVSVNDRFVDMCATASISGCGAASSSSATCSRDGSRRTNAAYRSRRRPTWPRRVDPARRATSLDTTASASASG